MKKQRQTFKLAWNTILLLIYRSATESSKYSRALFKHCNQAEITHRGTRPPLKTHSAPCWADRGVERKSKRKLAVFTSDWLRRAGAEAWTRHQYTWDDVRNAWQPMLGEKEQPPPPWCPYQKISIRGFHLQGWPELWPKPSGKTKASIMQSESRAVHVQWPLLRGGEGGGGSVQHEPNCINQEAFH